MMRLIVGSLCILVLATTLGGGAPPPPRSPPPPPPPPPTGPIAFHRIVMMWPNTACIISNCTPPSSDDAFTMRGVWPSVIDGRSKLNCSGAPAFSTSVIAPIKKEMEFCWPSYINTNDKLWKSVWDKHGSCSGMSILEYFTKGVNECLSLQAVQLSILTAFSEKRIVPGPSSTTYPAKDYYDALYKRFHVAPEIRCREYKKAYYLSEVVFCVNLNFHPINCPPNDNFTECGQPSIFPEKRKLYAE